MIIRGVAIAALALAVSGCEPAIECDADGYIVSDHPDKSSRNLQLATKRLDDVTGRRPYATAATLEKAQGCP